MTSGTSSDAIEGGARDYLLRPAFLSDAAELAKLGRESFCASFEHLYAAEDLSAFLESAYTPQVVEQEIADDRYIHQLADEEGALLGYCKMSDPSGYIEYSGAVKPIALNQLYTAPGMTGRGIGARLMDWAIAEAKQRGCDAIQLSVWSENFGAQRFYERYGFKKIADIDFWVGSHRDDEFLFEKRLGD